MTQQRHTGAAASLAQHLGNTPVILFDSGPRAFSAFLGVQDPLLLRLSLNHFCWRFGADRRGALRKAGV